MFEQKCIQFLNDLANSNKFEEIDFELDILLKMMNHVTIEELEKVLDILKEYDIEKKPQKNPDDILDYFSLSYYRFFSSNEKRLGHLGFKVGMLKGIIQNFENFFSSESLYSTFQSSLYGVLLGIFFANFIDYIQNIIDNHFRINILHQFKENIYHKIINLHSNKKFNTSILI